MPLDGKSPGTRSTGKSPSSRIPVFSQGRKRPAEVEVLMEKIVVRGSSTPKSSPATSGLAGLRKLELLAKAEAQKQSPGKAIKGGTVPWVEKHLPKSLDELFVHKKKVEEVMAWLDRLRKGVPGRKMNNICVINGPAGSGKTATVHLVGRKLDFDIKEWINPMSLTDAPFRYGESGVYRDDVPKRGQVEEFIDFLFRSSQYRALPVKGKVARKYRMIVVEDLPNVFYREPNTFHDILRKYSATGLVPLVFVFTDTANGDHSMYKMFPTQLLRELLIPNITFNPVATTLVIKFLLEICTKESMPVDKSSVNEIAATCNGDLRCAVNNLQFLLTKEKSFAATTQTPFKKPVAKSKRKIEKPISFSEILKKDNTTQLFRALGKVLYAKRNEASVNMQEMQLVGDLEVERRIHPLLESPESICDQVEVSADTFLGFLHQNYPVFYGSIDEMRTASEYLSISDFITSAWKFDDSGSGRSFKAHQVKDLVGMNVAVRGLMHSNTNRVAVGWKPLTKPAVSNLDKFTRDSVESTRQALFHLNELQTTLFTDTVPLYAKLLSRNICVEISGRREILEKGLFQTKCARATTLDENETGEENNDVPDEEKELQEETKNQKESDGVKIPAQHIANFDEVCDEEDYDLIEEFDD